MKKTKFIAFLLSATLVFSGCGNMNNTTGDPMNILAVDTAGKTAAVAVLPWVLLSEVLPDTAKVLLSVLPLVLPLVRVPVF